MICWLTNVPSPFLLGGGDGTFGPAKRLNVPARVNRAYVGGDFNGDGKLDLAINGPDDIIWLLLGNDDGTFKPASKVATAIHARSLTLGAI